MLSRIGLFFALFFLAPTGTTHAAANELSNEAGFISAVDQTKNKIASDVNGYEIYFSKDVRKSQNLFVDAAKRLSALEVIGYRRAIIGMNLIGYYFEEFKGGRVIHYNPTYDVGMVTEWDATQSGQFILKKLFLVSGELLRNEPLRILAPGWIEKGSMNGIIDAYKSVGNQTRDKGTVQTLALAQTPHQWTLMNGQIVGDREAVHERIKYVSSSLLSHGDISKLDQVSPIIVHDLQTTKPAVDAASDLQSCLKLGGTVQDILKCEVLKDKFKQISIPKTVSNQNGLGLFLGSSFVEGALAVGDIGMAFIASYSPANNYRFILTSKDGELSAISLVDFDAQ